MRNQVRPPRPQNKDAVIAWFNDEERIRGSGLDPNTNKPAEWFHGRFNTNEDKCRSAYLA